MADRPGAEALAVLPAVVDQRIVPMLDIDRPKLLQFGLANVRDDLIGDQLAIPLDRLGADLLARFPLRKAIEQILPDRRLGRLDIGALLHRGD